MAWRHIDFLPVRFVKGNTATDNIVTTTCSSLVSPRTSGSGEETKTFYEQLVGLYNEDSTKDSNKSSKVHSPQVKEITLNQEQHREATKPGTSPTKFHLKSKHADSAFLRAAQEGEMKIVSSMLGHGVDINVQDQYGWSALMCSTQAGHEHIIKLLLTHGADKLIADNHGRTALDLAKQCRHEKIAQMLETGVPSNVSTERKKSFSCSVCKASFSDTTKNAHMTSTIHLFNMKLQPKPTMYQLAETNPGFQMMLRSGWNREMGLGTDGQGQKFPVKTILKRDRKGFGCKSHTTAKVTHFGPKDVKAVNKVKPNLNREMKLSTLSKRIMKKASKKERRKDIEFRREFYID